MIHAKYSAVIGWKTRVFCARPDWIFRPWVFSSQSKRCILHGSSNHGMLPNDSVL